MNAKRQNIWNLSGGLCWYCGNELPEKGWHADHYEPIRRNMVYQNHEFKFDGTSMHPERDTEENKVPCCASCNILKGSGTIENFRYTISHFISSLNLYHNQYKFAKKFGLVVEVESEVKFWFEKNIKSTEPPSEAAAEEEVYGDDCKGGKCS